jgi:hypothetical protein
MIVAENFFTDFLVHFVLILAILYAIFYLKKMSFVVIAFVAALVITYINHMFYPELRLVELIEIFG